jgi:putative transcriptional regulator
MAKAYKSEALAAVHESMADLNKIGAIDSKTMREFDRACLTPVLKLSPAAIRRIRTKAAVSQAVFAAHLNVTTGVVSKWERGEKEPRGPAAKLLTLAAKHGMAAIA